MFSNIVLENKHVSDVGESKANLEWHINNWQFDFPYDGVIPYMKM